MPRKADGYEDEALSPEEQAALKEHMNSEAVPPEDDEAPLAVAEAEAAPAASAPVPETQQPAPAPAAPEESAPAPAGQTDDERFAAFMTQHAGKTPEELARLAFQQTQRAQAAGFQARQSQQTLEQVTQRVTQAQQRAAQRRQEIQQNSAAFKQRLQDDPDAATAELHERLVQGDLAGVDAEEFQARVDAAHALASTAIPEYQTVYPAIKAFGSEMGYSPQEIDGISDGRDIVTLHLARIAGSLIKAGVMDVTGKFIAAPPSVAATDPRLTTPTPPTTLSTAPARSGGGPKSNEQQLSDLLKLTDEDFDKFVATNPSAFENLMRAAG